MRRKKYVLHSLVQSSVRWDKAWLLESLAAWRRMKPGGWSRPEDLAEDETITRRISMAEKWIKCENCGAEVDVKEPRCPYCNSFLYEGAEKEYWDKMGQLHEDLKELQDVPEQAYKKEVKNQVRKIVGWMKKGAFFLLILGGLWMVYTSSRDMDGAEDWEKVQEFKDYAWEVGCEFLELDEAELGKL